MCVFCFRAIVNVALNISTMVDRKDKTEKKRNSDSRSKMFVRKKQIFRD